MRSTGVFSFTKWYMDCVAADGRVAIAYWASLAWGPIALTWHSVTLHVPGSPPDHRSSLTAPAPPDVRGSTLTWHAPALDCMVRAELRQPPFEERLLDDEGGVVDWRVEAPAANVRVEVGGAPPIGGPGYAERIVLTAPPWRLPIRELRWGRWIDADGNRSVVWIDWRGSAPRTWVFVDGVKAPAAAVTDDEVRTGPVRLTLGERRTLDARSLDEIAGTIPALRGMLPASLVALRQSRWCSTGTLQQGSGAELAGHAIHEVVVFG